MSKLDSVPGEKRADLSIHDKHLKKSVGAIHTSGTLTLLQRKLSNVLLFNAYDDLLSHTTHSLPLPLLCTMLGWESSNNIDLLKDALRALASTTVEFNLTEEGKEKWQISSLISFGEISDGMCSYRYDRGLAERLFDPVVYAMINLRIQREFNAGQALNLYENCVRYKNLEATGWWTIPFFREITGASSEYYDDFRRLNDRVIKECVNQINEVSDIELTPEFKRESRRVVALKFHIRVKTIEEQNKKQQQSIPGTSFKETIEQYAEIKALPVYRSLRDHGVSERLAITWIRDEGETRMNDVIAYVESIDATKSIKSTGGYIRKLVQEKAEVGESGYEKNKRAKKASEEHATKQVNEAELQKKQRELEENKALWDEFQKLDAEVQMRYVESVISIDRFAADGYKKKGIDSAILRNKILAILKQEKRSMEGD